MAKSRTEKENLLDQYVEDLKNSQAIFIVDSSKLSATQVTDIRVRLFELGAKFHVVKNTVFDRAKKASEIDKLEAKDDTSGPTGAFFIEDGGEVTEVAKLIKEFQKEFELMKSKFGFMEGKLLDEAQINALADLPSREELLAKTVYVIAGPVRNLMGVMNGATRDMVNVLGQIQESKEEA